MTKFSIVYSKVPSEEEGASICEALAKPCEQLLSAMTVALFCGAGPSLATEVIHATMYGPTNVLLDQKVDVGTRNSDI